jgi:metal-responsive CopG/Arc/MetJ family transcriptional regulator
MKRGRKPAIESQVLVHARVPESLLKDFDLINLDPYRGRARYGSRSTFILAAFRKFVEDNSDLLEATRRVVAADSPEGQEALNAFLKDTPK